MARLPFTVPAPWSVCPGARVSFPSVRDRTSRVAPAAMVMDGDAATEPLPERESVPASTEVAPVWALEDERTKVPAPVLAKAPGPEIEVAMFNWMPVPVSKVPPLVSRRMPRLGSSMVNEASGLKVALPRVSWSAAKADGFPPRLVSLEASMTNRLAGSARVAASLPVQPVLVPERRRVESVVAVLAFTIPKLPVPLMKSALRWKVALEPQSMVVSAVTVMFPASVWVTGELPLPSPRPPERMRLGTVTRVPAVPLKMMPLSPSVAGGTVRESPAKV